MKEPMILHDLGVSTLNGKFRYENTLKSGSILSLRVTVLRDAILLCFGISHHISDGANCFQVVQSFCDLLSNNPIPSFVLPSNSTGTPISYIVIFNDNIEQENDTHGHYANHEENYNSGIMKLGSFACRVTLAMLSEKAGMLDKPTTKFVMVPGEWADRIRAKAQDEIRSDPKYNQDCTTQLTRNDIIAAWPLKTNYFPLSATEDAVGFYGPIDYRHFIDPPKSGTYYIHNSIGALRCIFSVNQLQRESIIKLVLSIHITTTRYKNPTSIQQYLQLSEQDAARTFALNIRRDRNLRIVRLSPWTTYEYASLDFSGAMYANFSRSVSKSALIREESGEG